MTVNVANRNANRARRRREESSNALTRIPSGIDSTASTSPTTIPIRCTMKVYPSLLARRRPYQSRSAPTTRPTLPDLRSRDPGRRGRRSRSPRASGRRRAPPTSLRQPVWTCAFALGGALPHRHLQAQRRRLGLLHPGWSDRSRDPPTGGGAGPLEGGQCRLSGDRARAGPAVERPTVLVTIDTHRRRAPLADRACIAGRLVVY